MALERSFNQRSGKSNSCLLLLARINAPAHLVTNDSEAEVVGKIFAWHSNEGMKVRQITKRLTREGYPTPKGGEQWGETTIHKILRIHYQLNLN